MSKTIHKAAGLDNGWYSSAEYSPCERYRYSLHRCWNMATQAESVAFIGLNPSTATELVSDPTVTRCVNYARDWGFGGMFMLNLFAWRSTDPEGLAVPSDPVGPHNDRFIRDVLKESASEVVLCWGTHGGRGDRAHQFLAKLAAWRIEPFCLGLNQDGSPKHPLYLRRDAKRQPFVIPKR